MQRCRFLFRFQYPLCGLFGGDGARERRFKIRCHRGKAVVCHDAEIVERSTPDALSASFFEPLTP